MTLAKILRQKLSETPPAHERHEIAAGAEASGWTVHLTAERRDAWTTVVWEMVLRRAASDGKVAAWAEHIAQTTSGLLEPLRVVEVDVPHRRALVRSQQPTERDEKVSYYEVLLEGTSSAVVRRFEAAHLSGKRDQVAFVLTNEVLAKFVQDLTSA